MSTSIIISPPLGFLSLLKILYISTKYLGRLINSSNQVSVINITLGHLLNNLIYIHIYIYILKCSLAISNSYRRHYAVRGHYSE